MVSSDGVRRNVAIFPEMFPIVLIEKAGQYGGKCRNAKSISNGVLRDKNSTILEDHCGAGRTTMGLTYLRDDFRIPTFVADYPFAASTGQCSDTLLRQLSAPHEQKSEWGWK
jgi:hypothetical protein